MKFWKGARMGTCVKCGAQCAPGTDRCSCREFQVALPQGGEVWLWEFPHAKSHRSAAELAWDRHPVQYGLRRVAIVREAGERGWRTIEGIQRAIWVTHDITGTPSATEAEIISQLDPPGRTA